MIVVLAMALQAAAASAATDAALGAYGRCVTERSTAFHGGSLAADDSSTIVDAASLACRRERGAYVDAVDSDLKGAHPDLDAGGRAKIASLLVRERETELFERVQGRIEAKAK